jgi:hypothetical protein
VQNDTQDNDTQHNVKMYEGMLRVITLCASMLSVINLCASMLVVITLCASMLSIINLRVVMLSGVMPCVIMTNVAAPKNGKVLIKMINCGVCHFFATNFKSMFANILSVFNRLVKTHPIS